jgi:GGDEF domain-containing protein
MRIFDQIDPLRLERREWHLWTLALTVIVILSVGMALLMYPTVFGPQVVFSGPAFRELFFGFCGLSTLLVGYLVDRHIVISQLRKQLADDQKQMTRIRLEASADLLGSLPGIDHFRDRLAMEYRRASSTQQPLSLVVVKLTTARNVQDPGEIQAAYGDAAKALTRKLRGEDSIHRFAPGVFGIILPGVSASSAYRVADRLSDGLHDAAGASSRFSSEVRLFNYPEHVATARELDEAVRVFAPALSQVKTKADLAEASTSVR